MEGLDLNNILSASEIEELFGETQEEVVEKPDEKEPIKGEPNEKKTTEDEEPIDIEGLFNSEGVGSNKDNEPQGTPSGEGSKSSPNPNIYSSTLGALAKSGVLSGLSDDDINNANDVEAFADAIDKALNARFDERQLKIEKALNYGVEPNEIQKHENIINYLDSITEEQIKAETPEGETLRKNLIVQDLMNKGYKEDRIKRELKRSLDSGSDIEDALDALEENKDFFNDKYDELIKKAEKDAADEKEKQTKKAEALKKDIEESKNLFGDLEIDKATRAKIYENIAKASYRDPQTGKMLTAIQKYQKDNEADFLKNLGVLFTLTDGFKNIDKLVNGKVRKEVKKSLRELEHTLNSTARHTDGSLNYASGVSDDNSYIGAGLRLDI